MADAIELLMSAAARPCDLQPTLAGDQGIIFTRHNQGKKRRFVQRVAQ